MLCRSVDIGTGWRSCELFRAFEDGPSVGTFYGTPCIQMDVHLNGFFCVPSGLTWMKMLSRKLHNYAWTHWSVGAQHGTPAMTGARILLDNNCNGMVLIPSRAQVELMVADWRSDLPRKAEVDAVGTWKQESHPGTPGTPWGPGACALAWRTARWGARPGWWWAWTGPAAHWVCSEAGI